MQEEFLDFYPQHTIFIPKKVNELFLDLLFQLCFLPSEIEIYQQRHHYKVNHWNIAEEVHREVSSLDIPARLLQESEILQFFADFESHPFLKPEY